jgi:hypothetical protein
MCFTVVITVDNDASPNAGVEYAIANESVCKHIIHGVVVTRASSLAEAFPQLQAAIDK